MSLSKLVIERGWDGEKVNWRFFLAVGAPIALLGAAAVYLKYYRGSTRPDTTEEGPAKDSKGKKSGDEGKDKGGGGDGSAKGSVKELKDKGNALFKEGKYADALDLYTKAVEEALNSGDASLEQLFQNRAAVYEKLGQHPAVIRETSAALKLNPKYVKALHRRSKSYKATGFLDEALEDITAVCILEQFSSPSSVQLADEILKEIGALEGHRLLKSRVPPVNPSAHTIDAYIRGFYNCPVSVLKREASIPADGSRYSEACEAVVESDYDKVIDCCTKELDNGKTPYKLEALFLRGTFRFLYGYGDETLADLNAAISLAGDNKAYKATALIKRGSYYALVDQHDKCIESFDEAERTWPDNCDVYHHRGQVLLTRADLESALREMGRAVELAPEYGVCVATKLYVQYRFAGLNNDNTAQHKCANEYRKLLKKFSTSPDVFSLYGQILMENQLFEEAEVNFEKTLALDPNNASVLVHKAMSRFQRSGDPYEAIKMLTEALQVDDRNEFIYETLGTLSLQVGDLENASKYIGKALDLARSFQELTILSSLKKAAEVQKKVKDKLGLQAPSFIQ